MYLTRDIEAILQRHGYSTLPAPLEDTWLAVSHRESNGTVVADVLVYREVNGRGETLRREAAFLVEALPRISQQLCRQPERLSPDSQTHTITFLGQKVHLLVGGDGRLLRCRLSPLLILRPTTSLKVAIDHPALGLPAVPLNHLDQYMVGPHHATSPPRSAIDAWLLHFRRAHQLLGGALLAFLPLLGFALLFVSLGRPVEAGFTFTIATLSALALLLNAVRHFACFKNENQSSVLIVSEAPSLATACSTHKSQGRATNPPSSTLTGDEDDKTALWTPTNMAAFLLDSMQSAITACLSTYRAANWRAYAGHLSSLLTNGVHLALLKRTGRAPPQRTDELLDQLPAKNAGEALKAWLQRLAVARRGQPLTRSDAQEAAHFVVQLLRELDALPSSWEVQILRIVPPPPPAPSPTGSVDSSLPAELAATTTAKRIEATDEVE